jgi:hypothetical protein
MVARLVPRLRSTFGSALAWVVVAAAVVRVVGIGWGLPASDGWDNDGVAPRDFLAGLVETFTPGHFYTYPPVHLLLLAILTAPVTIVALVRAPSLSPPDVVGEIVKVPYMTVNAYVARLVSVAMSLGLLILVARITAELRAGPDGDATSATSPAPRRAGVCAAAIAAVNLSFTYYAHTTNLDVPYLFWAALSLLWFVRAMNRREPRLFRRALVIAVLSVATKDQAYGLFILAYPTAFAAYVVFDPWARERRKEVLQSGAIAAALALLLFLVADAVVFNPTGFRARVAFLAGSASKDFVTYTNDWTGRGRMLADVVRGSERYYPKLLGALLVLGLVLESVRVLRKAPRAAIPFFVPLLAALSFTVTFDFTALRDDHRFFLPQAVLLAIYGGLAFERVVFAERRGVRIASQAILAMPFALALFACLAVDAQLLGDPRYEAEAFLEANVKEGDFIETYGNNVYLPRFPARAHVQRVGPEPLDRRNPMPGVTELQARFDGAAERHPRFIVVAEGWAWRYLIDPNMELEAGRLFAPTQKVTSTDREGTQFFWRLTRSLDEYGIAHVAKYRGRVFPQLDIHASTSREVWIYERKPGR